MPIKLKNNVVGYLASAINSVDTGIALETGDGSNFPALNAGEYFYATLVSTNGTLEVVKVTARSGDSLSVTRAQEGSIAVGFAAGSKLELRITAQSIVDTIETYVFNVINYSATYDAPSISAGAQTTQTFTVTGAALGDYAIASFSIDVGELDVQAVVSAANTVRLKLRNDTASPIDLASATLRIRVLKLPVS